MHNPLHHTDTQAPLKAHAIDRSASLFPPPPNPIAAPGTTSVKKEGHNGHAQRGLAPAAAVGAGGGVGQGWFGSHNVPSDRDVYEYLGFGLKVNRRSVCWYIAHLLIWSRDKNSHHTP